MSLNLELRNLVTGDSSSDAARRRGILRAILCTIASVAVMLVAGSGRLAAQPLEPDSILLDDQVVVDTSTRPQPIPFIDTLAEADGPPAVLRYDSSDVSLRQPRAETMEEYRSDNDFVYDRTPRDPESLWQKFLRWVYGIFRRLFSDSEDEANFWVWLFRAIAVAAIVYVILKLAQTDLRSIFLGPAARPASSFAEVDENIHEMNFETLIDEAVAAGNYRRAVRLLYLRALKELTDQGLIEWRRDKTNHDYLRELRDSHLRREFAEATWMFEYVWYGDVTVNESIYRSISETFAGLRSNIVRAS